MTSKRSVAMAAGAALAVSTAVIITGLTPASAAETDCSTPDMTSTWTLASGDSHAEPNGTYFWSWDPGTFTACLDGPDDAEFDFVMQRYTGQDWQTVATATGSGADKSLSYTGEATVYRLVVTAVSGSGSYSVRLDRPGI